MCACVHICEGCKCERMHLCMHGQIYCRKQVRKNDCHVQGKHKYLEDR